MLKPFPCDRQLDMKDCGPACLKMIARHYGKYYSLQYMRDRCGITKEGVSLLDLSWEEKYVFKASFNGTVQFLGFWENDQFVQSGQPLFTIIPENKDIYGQVTLPAMGAGKVKKGQEVVIKLNDFPNLEYGTVSGRAAAISLTSKKTQTQGGAIESYLVTVKLPNGLMTNYGKELPFKQEAHGSAEIITKVRRLIERLFDNLRYAIR